MIFVYKTLRVFLYPFILIFTLVYPKARKRFVFERTINSLPRTVGSCHYAVEYSSEGELELVKPLLVELLTSGQRLELIFCSESVYEASLKFQQEYSDMIQLYCLPILSYFPLLKMDFYYKLTSPNLILTRYDFFPEIIHFGLKNKSFLISGSLKKFLKSSNILKRSYFRWVYSSFSRILMATELERVNLLSLFNIPEQKVRAFDFRVSQIQNRIGNNEKTLKERNLHSFFIDLENDPKKSIIYGSFWSDEVEFLDNLSLEDLSKYTHLFVPHKLDENSIKDCISTLKSIFKRDPIIINTGDKVTFDSSEIYVINQKGILCELYSFFDFSYIAGGFRSSVHSLLEPYLSGSFVLSGPNVHKSTEYDMIIDEAPERLALLDLNIEKQGLLATLNRFDQSLVFKNTDSKNIYKYKKWLLDNA